MATPEGRIKSKLKRELDKLGKVVYQFRPVQNGMGAPALDVYLSVCGVFVAIETKKPGGKPTARQLATMDDIRASGATAYVVSNDEEIAAVIDFISNIIEASRSLQYVIDSVDSPSVH